MKTVTGKIVPGRMDKIDIEKATIINKKSKINKSGDKVPKFRYSKKYYDEEFEYRHVKVPDLVLEKLPKPPVLLSQADMTNIGLHLSQGWINYLRHKPEPHILLVRRCLTSRDKLNRSMSPGMFPSFFQIDKNEFSVYIDGDN